MIILEVDETCCGGLQTSHSFKFSQTALCSRRAPSGLTSITSLSNCILFSGLDIPLVCRAVVINGFSIQGFHTFASVGLLEFCSHLTNPCGQDGKDSCIFHLHTVHHVEFNL
eukprot:1548280-Amphidinium_carterae.2